MTDDTLSQAIALVDAMALRLADVAEQLEQLRENPGNEEEGGGVALSEPVDEARWMRGARRELAELIREVEGPNPAGGSRR